MAAPRPPAPPARRSKTRRFAACFGATILISSCLPPSAANSGTVDWTAPDRAASAGSLPESPKPPASPDPWRRFAAPATGIYVGWFGKPCVSNGGGFAEIYSGGSRSDSNTANNPGVINATLDWAQNRFGTPLSLCHMFEAANGVGDFPTTVANECAKRQQLLMVSLSLGPLTAQELADGAGDAVWRNWAAGAKAWGKPVILRWGWEAPVQVWARDPVAYKKAWQRLWTIVKREVGATNVQLAFTPLYFYTGWGSYQDYFPGDAYVDWVGVDDYQTPSATFETSFKPAYDWFAEHAPGKPFMVSEWGMKHASDDRQVAYDVLPYPNDWYCQTLEAARTNANIKAYVLYDFDQEIQSALRPDWAGTQNLARKLLDPFFLKRAPVLQ
jgi:hypothetical protein